ncbi:Matrixin [Posidoniimonas polymericola]|uniref:Matrixin n=1 Tax=Posidoniimonas polymericola TaxID=2528002 RepID=A0A5C5YR30_9BACT|nr:matrixin family metalloprotease [Posidoniimonas polymericola]TWT77278.1 Matrixin [Posidoniimonas polymericola]
MKTTWLIALVLANSAATAVAYVPDDAWTTTASGRVSAGQGATLTWGIAEDGTTISGEDPSDLVSYLDDLFSETSSSSDLTSRSWFSVFQQSVDRWSELGGITFVYEENDNGSMVGGSAGRLGQLADVRIAGSYNDGPSGTLAYTWLPNNGDMVIDTGETSYFSRTASDYRTFRNTVMHELGHAIGLLHIESDTSSLLMEPYINTTFDGPQLDDIRGLHGLYGDVYEKAYSGQGNDTAARATSLGLLSSGGVLGVGLDAAGDQAVAATETDFVSITDGSDIDYYSFSVDTPLEVSLTLTPRGGLFQQGVQGGTQSTFDANARNNLSLAVYDSDGSTLLEQVDLTSAGGAESITGLQLAASGEYFARVLGADDSVQMYDLVISASAMLVALAGDYNDDGLVDAADYSVWRDSQDDIGGSLAADGDHDGDVDLADYVVWKNGFGSSSSGSSPLAVPEPVATLLAAFGMLFARHRRRALSRGC